MAGQKFPQVGLRAVFDLTGFTKPYNQYQRNIRDANKFTQNAAQQMSRSWRGATSDMARSFSDLEKKSRTVQEALDFVSGLNPQDPGRVPEITRWLRDAQDAFEDLGQGARVNSLIFDQLVDSGVNVADAMRAAGGAVEFNIDVFDKLVQSGLSGQEAFDAVVQGFARMRKEAILWTSAISASTVVLKLMIQQMREAFETYDEFAEATRRVRHQTGLLTREASSWITVLETSGVSTSTAERGMAQFLSKVADLNRELASGKEPTSDFAKAMDTLGVSVRDGQGNLRTTEEIMNDVNRAFQRLGSGGVSAQLATDLFGLSARQLLPILTDQERSLADLTDEVDRFGASLGAIDKTQFEELRDAQTRLAESQKGLQLEIARGWTETRTRFNNFAADAINAFRKLDAVVRASGFVNFILFGPQALLDLERSGTTFQERYEAILTGESEVSRALEESEQAWADSAQAAAAAAKVSRDAEKERQKAIDDTLQKLNELKAQYISKLNDIDRDAARKWDDILVQRMRAAMDKARQDINRIQDLGAALDKQLAQIEIDAAKRWEDILVNRQRDALLRGLRLAFRYEDLARNAERSRLDAIRDAADREAGIRRDAQKRVADAERDAQRRREELEREHQRRLRDIRQQFIDTATEAARRNDAVAVARAQRQRARDLRDERQRYDDERSDLERALAERRQDIERDRAQREQDHRNELARALQRIEENYARQREELERQAQRERLIRAIQYRWELEDFEAAKAEQKQAAQDAYDEQIAALQLANDRYNEELAIQYRRQEEDFNKAWQQRIDEANEWYAKERDDLAAHLSLTGQQLEAIYADWAREAAAAAAEVARATADALASEIIRYQHLLTEADRARATATPVQPGAFLPPIKAPYSVGPYPGAPVYSQAEGGVMQANSPTHVVMGDAGPETAVFMPGRAGSLNVNHNFGRMGVDFNGLPGGMNTQQVQNIVYSVMTQLAKGIQVPRN